MLQYQFVARYNFNKAERMNSALWFISIVTALFAFIPNLEDASWFAPFSIFVDIIILILWFVCKNAVQKAATLRGMFDDYVLGFNNFGTSKEKRTQLNESVTRTIQQHRTEAEIQMNNTGSDTPPGVKDWYEFPDGLNIQAPVLFCQRQNMWWTNKMMIIKSVLFVIEAIILIIFISVVFSISNMPFFEKAICILGFIIQTIDRVSATVRYCICCFKIIGGLEIQENNCGIGSLIKIQELINNLRNIPILGNNKLHQKLAKKLSKCFKETIEE